MKTIIAGSRTLRHADIQDYVNRSGFEITEVICGGAIGIDTLGKNWAISRGIPVTLFPAKWDKNGKSAGMIRNNEMAEYADAAIIITTGSRGSANMIHTMARYRKPCRVFGIRSPLRP